MGQNCAKQKSPKQEEEIPDKVKDDMEPVEDQPIEIDVEQVEKANQEEEAVEEEVKSDLDAETSPQKAVASRKKKGKESHRTSGRGGPLDLIEALKNHPLNDDLLDQTIIEYIWAKYVPRQMDGTPHDEIAMDQEMMRAFLTDTLREMGEVVQDGERFNNEDFKTFFIQFDPDRKGTVNKDDMLRFVKKVTGLQVKE